jgi:hypothetical protein
LSTDVLEETLCLKTKSTVHQGKRLCLEEEALDVQDERLGAKEERPFGLKEAQ